MNANNECSLLIVRFHSVVSRLFVTGFIALLVAGNAIADVDGHAKPDGRVQLSQQLITHLTTLPTIKAPFPVPANLRAAIGEKVTVVTFFASWCPPCRKEFAVLNKIRTEFDANDVSIVAINVFENFPQKDAPVEGASTNQRLSQFLSITNPQFMVLAGNDETRLLFGNISRIPTLFVFNAQGKAMTHFIHKRGARKKTADSDEIRNAINRALNGGILQGE